MTIKKLFALLSYTAVFCFTLAASIVVAQIAGEGKPAQSNASFRTRIAGAWRFNAAESDDVLTKIGELLKDRNAPPNREKSDSQQSGQPAVSISLFAPDALILSKGDADEMTINEIFKSVIETRTVSVDGTLREYEIYPGAKFAITATGKTGGLTIEIISPRGNKMTETFALAPSGSQLIVTLRFQDSLTREIFTLRRVYERASPGIALY